MMGLSGLGLDKELSTIMNANRANPAALQGKIAQQQRAGVTPQLLEVLASQKLLKEKQAAKTALMASQQQNPATIAQQQDQALRQGAMADLQREVDVAKQVGMANNMKARQRQKAMTNLQKMLTGGKKPRGIVGAPVPRPMKVAQGGIAPTMKAAQGGPVKFENGGIIDYIKENPFEAASLGLLVIPGLGLVNVGARIAYAGARYGIPAIARFLTSKPGMLTQLGIGTGVGLGENVFDLDEKFGADPADVELDEVVVDGPKYDEPIGPKKPVTQLPVTPSGPTPDSPLKGLPSIPMIEKKPDYEPDALANLGTFLSSFGGGNPAAVAQKLRGRDFQRQQDVDEANLGIEQQNIANLLSEGELKFNFAKLQEDTNLRKDLQLSRSKDALVQRLNTAAESRRKAEKDFEESSLGINLSRQLLRARNKLMTEGKGEQEYTLIKEQYDKVKNAYLSVYDGQIAAIQERLDALDINLDQKPVQIN